MSEAAKKTSRRQQILETLAQELEKSPGERITTAGLARAVGVSEAALYRHFPSKAKMFEALIEFIEDSIFGLTNRILDEERVCTARCEKILLLVLGFAARNPGISRLLVGDVLVGETERLRNECRSGRQPAGGAHCQPVVIRSRRSNQSVRAQWVSA